MKRKQIVDTVKDMVAPLLERMSIDLVDVEYVKEANNWYLRVYIDKPARVTIDDCQAVSEWLSDELDRIDIIKHGYTLEVSSPGLDRPLKSDKDFERYKGETVMIKLFKEVDGSKVYEGELLGMAGNNVTLKLENGVIMSFNKNEIASAKRTIKF